MGRLVCFYLILKLQLCFCEELLFEDLKSIENAAAVAECVKKILVINTDTGPYKDVFLTNTDHFIGRELCKLQGYRFESRSRLLRKLIPANAYIIMCEGVNDLKDIIDFLKKDGYWNPGGFYIIAMEKHLEIDKVENLLLTNYIYNVSIIVQSMEVNVIYAFGAAVDACNKPTNLEFISNCSNAVKQNFPIRKEQRLKGCRVNVVSHHYWPFISFSQKIRVPGVEGYLLQTLQEKEGLNINLQRYERDEDFGAIFDNLTVTGMVAWLQNNTSELAIGGFYLTTLRHELFDCAYPYVVDGIRIILPQPNVYKTWEAVYIQLTLPTILVIVLYFIFFCMVFVRLAIFRGHRKDFTRELLIVYGYFLNNIIRMKVHKCTSIRLIVLDMVMFVFFMNCVIQAALLSVNAKPIRRTQVHDIETAFRNYRPTIQERYVEMVEESSKVSFCATILDCMAAVVNDKSLFTIAPDLAYDHSLWRLEGDGYSKLYKTRESLGTSLRTVLGVRGSPIMSAIKRVTVGMQNGGLITHYLNLLKYEAMRTHHYNETRGTESIGMDEFSAAFYILFGGLSLSALVFIVELWVVSRE